MSGYHVLVVDDDEAVHAVVGSYLELSGYRVSHAMNGRFGLDAISADAPDLVIVDIQMPVLDGFGLVESVRNQPGLDDLPLLVLSSLNRPNLKVKALQLGADDYLVKPFDRAELLARVGRALQRSDRFRRISHCLAGDLGQMSLEELLQTMELGRKTARIELQDTNSLITVRKGELLDARWENFQGASAMSRILVLARGRFRIDFDIAPEELDGEAIGPIRNLLLQNTVLMDDLMRRLGSLPARDETIIIETGSHDFEIPQSVEIGSSVPLDRLLMLMDGDFIENVEKLKAAIDDGFVRVADDKE